MKSFSRLIDTLLIYAIAWPGTTSIYGLPDANESPAEKRPARWRLRLAHP